MSTCTPIRSALADCLLASPCVSQQGHSAQDCLRDHALRDALPDECKGLYRSYVECRRSMLDMRKRFRGNFLTPPGVSSSPAYTPSDASSNGSSAGSNGAGAGSAGIGTATSAGLGASPSAGINPT
ncbi:hypothetical protein OC834_004249 [Tilletia horrida]|nr:hypothetical protein OC834_004249 [Tilletia horrida]KAK0541352.1 hypothetical protein OC835_000213 [Tilletia horrida]